MSLPLVAGLVATLIAFQLLLATLARAFSVRLPRWAMAAAVGLPLVVLQPWLGSKVLLAPTSGLVGQVPGTMPTEPLDPHGVELGDVAYLFFSWEAEVRHAFAAGHLPFWTENLDGGSSPWVNLQAAILSPIAWGARWAPLQHFLLICLALKILVALNGAYVFARTIGVRPGFALFAGISFGLSGAISAWALFPHSAVAAWMPWLAAAVVRAMRRRDRRMNWIATSGVAATLLLSGHPEVALAAALFALVAAFAWARRESWRARTGRLTRLAGAALLALGLTAPALVPFADAASRSLRAETRRSESSWSVATEGGAATQETSGRSLFPPGRARLLLTALHPRALGSPFANDGRPVPEVTDTIAWQSFAGALAWIGAVGALVLAWRRAGVLFFAGLAMLAFAAGFRPLVALVEWSHVLRAPEATRLLPFTALALAILGGMGWQALVRGGRGPKRATLASLAVAGAVVACLAVEARGAIWLSVGGAAMALACGTVGSLPRFSRSRRSTAARLAAVALCLVTVIELVPWARRFLPRGEAHEFFPQTSVVEAIRRAVGDSGRFVAQDYLAYPSVMAIYGVADVRPNSPLAPAAQIHALGATLGFSPDERHYYGQVVRPRHPLARFLGVRAVLSNGYLPQPTSAEDLRDLRILGRPEGIEAPWLLWIDQGDLPPRWFVPRRLESGASASLATALAALDDPWTVIVAPEVAAGSNGNVVAAAPSLEIVARGSGWASLRLTRPSGSEGGATVVASSEPYPAGWTARSAAGERLEGVTVNGAFTGFRVPAGVERIEVRFRPPGLGWGVTAFVVASGVLAALRMRTVALSRRV